jgi:O-antigen/teichoic acid export membrane protein
MKNKEKTWHVIKKSIKFTFLFIGVASVLIILFGKQILFIFGEKYSKNAYDLLVVLTIGCIPFALSTIYAGIKRIQNDMIPVLWIYGSIAILTIITSFVLIPVMGSMGVALAWVLANIPSALIIGIILINKRIVQSTNKG